MVRIGKVSKTLAPLALLVASFLSPEGAAADPRVISSDLAFHFACSEADRDSVEDRLMAFLGRTKFKALNQGRLQRQHQVHIYDLRITALDEQSRIFDVFGVRTSPGRYSATLVSPPPTRRAPELESALLDFVSSDLKCEVYQVSRNENPADAASFHEMLVKRIEGLFRHADELSGGRRL